MKIHNRFWRFAGVTVILVLGSTMSLINQASVGSLGSPALCVQYSGVPIDWGHNRHSGMVHIKGGGFIEGTTLGYEDERSEVSAKVQDFWIDQTEVTVVQFADFVKATGYVTEAEKEGGAVVFHKPGNDELANKDFPWWVYVKGANWRHPAGPDSSPLNNQPVTLVTLADALAYARWLGRDLPTEAQWEYAAKAGNRGADLEKEPRDASGKPVANFWQGPFPSANSAEDGHEGLGPVGCYAANGFKLYDMIGNAWEQTKDPYLGPHPSINNPDPTAVGELSSDRPMVIKGGSHLCARDFCVRFRPSAREAHEANLAISHIGFRTVMVE